MLQRIKYFQSVIRNNSFSEAAEECHISQSAISQQIQALERELGFALLERQGRKFVLTPAGEYFYQKSLILVSDLERLCAEAAKIADGEADVLSVGVPRCYGGTELHRALETFSVRHRDVTVEIVHGNHEEIYDLLRTEGVDMVMNDQRRAFSDEYENVVLAQLPSYIEIAVRSPLSQMERITPRELKNTPCILVASPLQREVEREYYSTIMGFRGEFYFVETTEAARLAVIGGKGFLPMEGGVIETSLGVARIPLVRNEEPMLRTYGVFWKKAHPTRYVEEFAALLKEQF